MSSSYRRFDHMVVELKGEIVKHLGEVLTGFKNVVVSGNEGVGKLKYTIAAFESEKNLYYIGNPFDYEGKARPQGYDEYVRQVKALKADMHVIIKEGDILSLDLSTLSNSGAVVVIDEMYGRCPTQCEKLLGILVDDTVHVAVITGCLRNLGVVCESLDKGVLLTTTGLLVIEQDFLKKMCNCLRPEPF